MTVFHSNESPNEAVEKVSLELEGKRQAGFGGKER